MSSRIGRPLSGPWTSMPGRASSPSRPVRKPSKPLVAAATQAFRPKRPAGQKAGTPDSKRRAAHTAHQFDVSIYCDGACEPNPGNAGSGIVVYRAGELAQLWFGLYNPMGTNNTAELNALYHALRMAEAEIKTGNTVEVCSDSAYSINCIRSWAPNWEKKGWKNLAARSRTWKSSGTVTRFTDGLKKN